MSLNQSVCTSSRLLAVFINNLVFTMWGRRIVSTTANHLTAESSVAGQPLLFISTPLNAFLFVRPQPVTVSCNRLLHLFTLVVAGDCVFGNTAFSGTIVCLPDNGRMNKELFFPQCHHMSSPLPPSRLWLKCNRLLKLGRPVGADKLSR